ncbi:MAG: DUF922 domain-containing protein [Pseudomonadota bacterium]
MKSIFGLLMAMAGIMGISISVADEAHSKVILKEQITYYNVKGRTGREIFKSMIENGPQLGGRRGHALATTEYNYDVQNIDVEIRNGRCIPVELDVHLNVTYTYPRWVGNNAAKGTTQRAWKRFNKSVIWHEKQHVKIAMEYAKDYEKALRKSKLRASQNCSTASFGSVWRATRAALKHNRKQKQFDRRDLRPGGRGYEAQLNLIRAK